MMPPPLSRALVILATVTMAGIGVAGVDLTDRLQPELSQWAAQTVALVTQVSVQIAVAAVAFRWPLLKRRRARRLLRHLVTEQQWQCYVKHGHILETIGPWNADIFENGTRWHNRRAVLYGGNMVWECIYVDPAARLCKEDRILAQLLHARQAEYPRRMFTDQSHGRRYLPWTRV